ncbi:MAG: outer membrane beta-barrel protein [Bacteroidetes bacterium]|nr:outer membrane beta-barrel protein [Bacteroidota bacterium]
MRHRRRVASPALEIGMILNPTFNGLNLRLASAWFNYVHEDYLGIRRSQESPLEALQGGLDLALRLRGGLRFNSGLWFTEQGYRQQYDYNINKLPAYRGGTSDLFGNRLIEAYFIDPTPEQVRYTGTSRIQMIQIPVQMGYEHRLGLRGGITVQAGTAASFLMSSEGMNISYSNLQLNSGNSNWFRNTQWTVLGSVSCYRQVNPFMRLGLGLRRSQALSNEYKSGAPIIGKGGSTGIQFNLHYRIY